MTNWQEINDACGITQSDLDLVAISARHAEIDADIANAPDSFSAYWAGSASASVLRDYKAKRGVNV